MRIGPALAAGLLVLLPVGAVIYADRRETALDRVQRTGVIRAGYAPEAPFAFVAEDGTVTGEGPEVLRAALRGLGIRRIEWVQTEFALLIPELDEGRFDVIGSVMFVTPERERQVDFTVPTLVLQHAMLVRRGNPLRIHSYENLLAAPGARLAAVSGGYEWTIARSLGFPPERLVRVPDARTGAAALRAGTVDAFALTAPSIQRLAGEGEAAGVERALPFRQPEGDGAAALHGAFGVRERDGDLLAALNRQLSGFVGTPAHLRLVRPFGFTAADLPHPVAPPTGRRP